MSKQRISVLLCAFVLGCGEAPPPPASPPPPPPAAAPPVVSGAPVPSAPPASVSALAKGSVLFDDLGTYHKAITASADAQKYFDQGLRLTYGFNHDEATRLYARGAEIDPGCAMCFWGVAITLGPNYNVPMLPNRAAATWDALERARALAGRATPVEKALIEALAKRYKGPEPLDPVAMQPYNVAYADAMREVAKKFPDDLDVQVLFAESMMDVRPWKLWTLDGKAEPGTDEIVGALEKVLARDANHPGANHYYIHAIEASSHPEKALPSAERLASLVPGAGHIVHMPAHIYQRVGRYADASAANEKAVQVDLAYLKKVDPPGYYPMYLGHNYGFLSFSASMEGRSALSIASARETSKAIPPGMIDMMPGMDFFVAEPLLAMVRFGKWDDLLAEPKPESKYLVLTAFWHHGHGMASAAKGKMEQALADHAAILKLMGSVPPGMTAGNNNAVDVFGVAAKVLEARIATLQKKPNALALWGDAVAMADKLAYSEPDDWFYSVRHYQGAALLGAGKAKEAEAVYREDLVRHPNNGWALFGLTQALQAQKRATEAILVKGQAEKAWAKADFKLVTTAL